MNNTEQSVLFLRDWSYDTVTRSLLFDAELSRGGHLVSLWTLLPLWIVNTGRFVSLCQCLIIDK